MVELLALVTIMLWPAVPLFWIPVHAFPKFFRKIGLATYIVPLITWLPAAYFIYAQRSFLLHYKIHFPEFVDIPGIVLLIAGTLVHIWTGRLLSLSGLIGVPEVSAAIRSRFVAEGAFSVVRHPTYLAHTMMFLGVFLVTGVVTVGIITIVDLLVVNMFVIPLEERELLFRFGEDYKHYKEKVPRFFPKVGSHK
jgi:protein-S-isoprenylcysteine O-methyltransferase Ste14